MFPSVPDKLTEALQGDLPEEEIEEPAPAAQAANNGAAALPNMDASQQQQLLSLLSMLQQGQPQQAAPA